MCSQKVRFTDKPLIIHWHEGLQLLAEAGIIHPPMDDLTSAVELKLGEIIAEKYKADFFILDQYPTAIRPFYTMPNATNPLYSNSYDLFIRGQVCSLL